MTTLKQVMRWANSRPHLRCSFCGYSWQPRGKNYSLRCPSCKAELVGSGTVIPAGGLPKGCAIALLVFVLGGFGTCVAYVAWSGDDEGRGSRSAAASSDSAPVPSASTSAAETMKQVAPMPMRPS